MSRTNNVTLFSNGIGHFRRVYTISKEESISIPFKSDCIGDVAASLQVFGKVRLNSPPSFTPANSYATALSIEQDDAMKSMLRQLSGSQIKLSVRGGATAEYTLLGLDSDTTISGNNRAEAYSVVAMKSDGNVRRFPLSEVLELEFTDEGVRTEIKKALKSNFQQIKPDSTLLDLSLSPVDGKDVEAIVQYTIPVAAWKMRYAIREDKGKFSLEGAAIIDNNTDEDWINFNLSVVTGNPISFNTDIANVVVPERKMVYLVDRMSQGNVEATEAYAMACSATAGGAKGLMRGFAPSNTISPSVRQMSKSSVANYAQFGLESMPSDDGNSLMQEASGSGNLDIFYAAEAPGVDSKDVGDFCVFTSKEPITIFARKSAVVPMFSKPLDSAGVVLLYKEQNNARRPFRAVKFKNETEYTLGRGKTVIYNEGLFSGECVLETTKPSENRMLPHCLENGVKIVKEIKGRENRRSFLKIADGVGISEDVQTAKTNYVIENKKDELFKVALEHTSQFGGNAVSEFSGIDLKDKEKLADGTGHRLYFELKAKESVTLTVTEIYVNRSTVTLGNNLGWLRVNVIDIENPLSSNKQIQACISVQKDIDDVADKLQTAQKRLQELSSQVERVRDNLAAAKDVSSSQTRDNWIADLDLSEKEIRQINKDTIPNLSKKQRELTIKLGEEMKKITASWDDKK